MSPEFGGAVAGSGIVQDENRRLSEFDSITIKYPAEIIIQQGNSESILIEADDNLLPQLETEVKNGRLVFENSERDWKKRVKPSTPVLVTITVVDLDVVNFSSAGMLLINDLQTNSLEINISGAGEITLTDLDTNDLTFSLSGTGSVEAEGRTDRLDLRISGLGSFDGSDLKVMDAGVSISGAGSATVWVEDELGAIISGAGSIDYFGDPEVNKTISGAGNVHSLGNKD